MTGGLPARVTAALARHRVVIVVSPLTDVRALTAHLNRLRVDFQLLPFTMSSSVDRREFGQLRQAVNWHLLPMVFVDGVFAGGEPELMRLLADAAQ